MSLSARAVAYLVAVHAAVTGLAIWALRESVPWLVAVEAALAVSLLVGVWLVRRLVASVAFVSDSPQWLADSDFMSRFQPTGQAEVDRLVSLYNRMIDQLRAARVAAEEQQQFLLQVMQASPAGLVVLDFDGRVASVNPAAARMLGLAPTDVVGRSVAALNVPLARQLEDVAAGEARLVSPGDGRRLRVSHGTFVDRGFRRGFFTIEELTEEVRRLERAAHEKLIRLLSHEVNNTVGAASSLLQSCLTYGVQLAPEDRRDYEQAIGVVIDRTARLNDFLRGFAEVYRLRPPRTHPCDLRDVVEAIGALMRPLCESKRVRWQAALPDRALAVELDRGQFEQALLNVAKNAVEAAEPGGSVTVRLEREGPRVRLDVVDTGPGLGETARAGVFTPFFSTKPQGQGLGLTLVQEVLANHGFPFTLDGPPGGPTTFSIWMPAVSEGGTG